MVLDGRWMNTITEWYEMHNSLVYMGIWKHQHEESSKLCLMDMRWWSKPLAHILWCTGMCLLFCVYNSSKVKILCSLSVNLECTCLYHRINWLLSFNFKSVISLRDAVTGSILSLTTNHVCSLCSLDFGYCIQWSGFRNCFQWCLLLLLTLHLCRFSVSYTVHDLTRSYNWLSSLGIASVDWCCLYIIIHNSMLQRTWSKRSAC